MHAYLIKTMVTHVYTHTHTEFQQQQKKKLCILEMIHVTSLTNVFKVKVKFEVIKTSMSISLSPCQI